jgi:hypothetical protein
LSLGSIDVLFLFLIEASHWQKKGYESAEGYEKGLQLANPDFMETAAFHRNFDKVKGTFSQLVRDWADEGEEERRSSYQPILDEIDKYFEAVSREGRGQLHVLCPG